MIKTRRNWWNLEIGKGQIKYVLKIKFEKKEVLGIILFSNLFVSFGCRYIDWFVS
jgi:hypothetical protein